MRTIFLTLEQTLYIHEEEINRYGGSSGVRDLTLLESALFRPQTTFGGRELYPTLFSKAASLMHSIINNHPFVDGNKRTGTAAMLVFLDLNGNILTVSQKELVYLALDTAAKKRDIKDISEWLEENSEKI